MKINIRGEKIEVTPAIRQHIESKITKLEPYFENSDELTAYVLIKIRRHEQIIEVTVPTKKFTLRAEERHSDLYASVDLVIDKLERQIRKNKSRLKKHKHQPISSFAFDDEIEKKSDETDTLNIVRRKIIDDKPMSEEEAILQMELLNHGFFLFKNIDEECISVVYVRKDGEYGIISMK